MCVCVCACVCVWQGVSIGLYDLLFMGLGFGSGILEVYNTIAILGRWDHDTGNSIDLGSLGLV